MTTTSVGQVRCRMLGGEEGVHVRVGGVERQLPLRVPVWSPGDWVELVGGELWARRTASGSFELLLCEERDGELTFRTREAPRELLVNEGGLAARWWASGGMGSRVPAQHPVRAYRAALHEMYVRAYMDIVGADAVMVGGLAATWLERQGDERPTWDWHALVSPMPGQEWPSVPPCWRTATGDLVEVSRCGGCPRGMVAGVSPMAWQRLGVDPQVSGRAGERDDGAAGAVRAG